MIKQFVPQEVCLDCHGCCRFKEANSVWSPCLLDEEIQGLVDNDLAAVTISLDKRLGLVKEASQEGFLCPLLNPQDNKCKIYARRPFECQLYPFLIGMRNKKVILTVDLNCPYIQKKIKDKEFEEYVEYLSAYLNSPAQLSILKDNPQIIQAYEEVLDIMELKI